MKLCVPFSRCSLSARIRQILDRSRLPAPPLSAGARPAVALSAVIVLGLSLLPAAAAPEGKTPGDPLAEDPRLAQKVSLSIEGLPVGDLLALLKQKTGISLAASPETADDKVLLFDSGRPLREILADLAALFNDWWERRPSANGHFRYTLTRDRRAREYEDLLARAAAERVQAALERQVQTRAAGTLPEHLTRRAVDGRVRDQFLDPKGRAAAKLYLWLNPDRRRALFARGRLSIPFAALPPEQRRQMRDTFVTRILADERATWEEESKIERDVPLSKPETLENAGLRFEVHHTAWFSELLMLVGHTRIDVARADSRARWQLPTHGDPYSGAAVAADAPLPVLPDGQATAAAKRWPDRLRALAQASGVPVMADFYRGGPITRPLDETLAARWGLQGGNAEGTAAARSRAEAAALDSLCQPEGYLWWTHGRSLLLRKRDWYDQRRYEVPDRWILAMAARLQPRRGVPTYADVMLVLELTPEQIAGLNSAADPGRSINSYMPVRELLAIVQASLRDINAPLPTPERASPEEWRRTWLTYDELTPQQRLLLPAFLETYSYPVAPRDAEGFKVRLAFNPQLDTVHQAMRERMGGGPPINDPNYRYSLVSLSYRVEGDGSRIYGREVHLPASLPDDRRAKTKIELIP